MNRAGKPTHTAQANHGKQSPMRVALELAGLPFLFGLPLVVCLVLIDDLPATSLRALLASQILLQIMTFFACPSLRRYPLEKDHHNPWLFLLLLVGTIGAAASLTAAVCVLGNQRWLPILKVLGCCLLSCFMSISAYLQLSAMGLPMGDGASGDAPASPGKNASVSDAHASD